ncbi:hypothetical protein [Wenzhouxiangella limi]|uniref:Lipoprotein n=1 Tax=Wenzhouxiangella limi TaxID=2707351 RepID=A0A845UTB3_9GAMM|nr:hypothetical protein [Wenzhouxiangella limi]NDY94777.1 hypothetical protein [Wenzhouxiangella limi]
MIKPTFYARVAVMAIAGLTAACSDEPETGSAGAAETAGLPDTVVGTASWDDHLQRPIHRVQCDFEAPFYKLQAQGHGFELTVGFWGDEADRVSEVDFEQADSVELVQVTPEEEIYRYTTLRILPEMGQVSGSETSASGTTRLRSTSLAALEEYRNGIELDFEFSCPLSAPDQAAES